jgi:P-type conjugative transfer protein TrbJ
MIMAKPPRLSRVAMRKTLTASALALAAVGALAMTFDSRPANAQITVFDPANYSLNLLSAARALSQINNQIRALQNQATMLAAMQRNLQRIDFPQLHRLEQSLERVDQLMTQAKGIDFHVDQLDAQFSRLFPEDFDRALTSDQRVAGARTRLDTAMAAYRQTMKIQAEVVGNVAADAHDLAGIAGASQGAQGALQAAQATNQLLALAAKQQLQIETMMAAQYRADALGQARRVEAETEARAATKRFLGSGSAYTPD